MGSGCEALIDDAGARRRMGLAAREFAGTLDWEAVLDDMLRLHSRLAGVRPPLAASV